MANENQKSENTQGKQPSVQVELTDEQLEQVTGGADPLTNNDDKIRRVKVE